MNSSIASLLVVQLAEASDEAELLSNFVRQLRDRGAATAAAVVRSVPPEWVVVAASPAPLEIPVDLVAESLDRGVRTGRGDWLAIPMPMEADLGPTALALRGATIDEWEELAATLAVACRVVRGRALDRHRVVRLQRLLEMTHDWARTDNLEALLNRMAEVATELFACDRATIFLWDRPQRMLVGRPALGLENNELRVSDKAGVVGRTVQTGEPQRVDLADDRTMISHDVDRQTGYTTRTLLCVPLVGPGGETLGAFELLNKHRGNFTPDDLTGLAELARYAAVALANTREWQHLLSRHRQMVAEVAGRVEMVGNCPPIAALRSTISKVADTDLAILVLGENGTGKEVVAQSMHYQSRRRNEPFVAVNCAALTETLLESELFGHEKGAFTDARETRAGKFEVASGGTLFLDEIGDMSRGGQAKLLRVLEEKTVVRVGGNDPIETDVRVVAATNQDLAQLVREKKFREDLYFRLNVVTLELPPLRERGDDVLLLAEYFLQQHAATQGRRPLTLSAAAKKRLVAHRWPGNVRELRNLMERVAYLATGPRVEPEDLAFTLSPASLRSGGAFEIGLPLQTATQEFQVDYIQRTIAQVRGNVTEAARLLGVHRSNLYRKMRSLGMESAEESPPRQDE